MIMKTHTHTDKNFLPPYFQGAQMIRYVPPIYEYEERYDDEQEEYYEDRQCINEEECTSHEILAEKVQSEQHPIYFFRRTLREAKWSMQRLQSIVSFRKFKLTIARFNRRVLIIAAAITPPAAARLVFIKILDTATASSNVPIAN